MAEIRRPNLPKDSVEYRLFPPTPKHLWPREQKVFVEQQIDYYLAHLSDLLVDYIWQNEPLQLCVSNDNSVGVTYISGTTNFGDNIEDEWFIVYLMHKLTEAFPGLVVKINDNDGEFLLIQAAESLPKWVEPDTAENRVFIFEGKIHIIPRPENPGTISSMPSGTPTLQNAVNCIRMYPQSTVANDRIQNEIQKRIKDFPDKAKQFIHVSHCYIPASLAAVLDHKPSLVAPIVQAFYYRDPIDLKACVTMKHFRPGTRVMREVKFTKCLYAQLMQQRFKPDKRSGWNPPAASNPKSKSYDLGTKLAHGAEILCSKCGDVSEDKQQFNEFDGRWKKFVEALSQKGYFQGEIEGSKLYQKLLEDAKNYFYRSVIPEKEDSNVGQEILRTLGKVTYDIEVMRKEEANLGKPDDDSWLELSPQQLDDMLNKAAKSMPPSDSFDLSSMSESMQSFVDNVSSHEGAEFPESNRMSMISMTSEDGDIQFDPNSIMQNMQKMFEFDDGDSASSSDMDEYGSDDELDSMTPTSGSPTKKKTDDQNNVGEFLGMKDYMDIMDRELENTTIGESFVKQQKKQAPPARPTAPPRTKKTTKTSPVTNGNTQPGSKIPPRAALADLDDVDDIDDEFTPVDVDLNMVQNIMQSYDSQQGLAGPAGNILGSMGVRVPRDGQPK